MADKEHLALLKNGVKTWNRWRLENEDATPNLSEANLSETNLTGTNLSGTNLSEANLSGANLSEANLSGANLSGANLAEANLTGGNLRKADLSRAALRGANLRKADLSRATLTEANLSTGGILLLGSMGAFEHRLRKTVLSEANLTGAKLTEANLSGATLTEANLSGADLRWAQFSSQQALEKLAAPLSEEQLLTALFEDEIEFARLRDAEDAPQDPLLRLRIPEAAPWTPMDMAGLLLGIQVAYNNMHYLMTTENEDLEHIRSQLADYRRVVGVEDNIRVHAIQSGSLVIELANLAPEELEVIKGALSAMRVFIPAFLTFITAYKVATAKEIEAEENAELGRAEAEKIREETRALRHKSDQAEALAKASLEQISVKSETVNNEKYRLFTSAAQPLINILLKLEKLGHGRIIFEVSDPKSKDKK